jgi:hypothetical protein
VLKYPHHLNPSIDSIPLKFKFSVVFLKEKEKIILKLIWHMNIQSNHDQNNKSGCITFPYFKVYESIRIKIALYWHKSRHIDSWNRTENPELNPSIIIN